MILFIIQTAVSEPCDSLKKDMVALEIYLQDQEDYRNYCPDTKWDQPDLDIYKEELKSQLPEDCKKDEKK
jgi:hypothetical protein